ncbi:hypothetical protein [Aeromicrobium ginsengisoli]|uniref:Glycosyltransferase RgtA/B/C/D-like domain-containing protein n=1 Tax=Aeromicrobium ginsengisoli TaxID=363867 RepID=A0A5M4FB40_9ACTN|nr:hypothetical protein [Aeromicrobium ginsengisoli]KAA1394451.1 hypothetical protein ESP70_019870 [Aeromicrobium ginsengisoli]
MTALADRSLRTPAGLAVLPGWTVAGSAAVAVAARLPYLAHAASPDEAGFLLVGGQWHRGGSSLYGNLWVDRPPLLITIFRLADGLGGLMALRLIGCVAVALVVLGAARVAAMIAGQRAAGWAAITAAGLCVSPLLGGYEVNGELLAAPLTLAGMAGVILAVRSTDRRTAVLSAMAAGACAMASLLVKQNLADAAVFGLVAFALSGQHFWMRTRGAVTGAFATAAVVAVWTVAHGTSLAGVFDAMYPFRIHADQVQAAGGSQHSVTRLTSLAVAFVVSGLAVLLLAVARDVVRHRRRDPLWSALVVMTGFGVVSVLLGGNYWHHYLVELVVPLSVATGVLAARRGFAARSVVAYVAIAGCLCWALNLTAAQGSTGRSVGQAVAASAQPGDTIVTVWGHANVTYASGLSSPYAQLWSLPVKTLDPQLTGLDDVLTGPAAPTWVVVWQRVPTWGLDTARTSLILAHDYRRTGTVCGRTIYLRAGVDRRAPTVVGDCHGSPTRLKDLIS